ncbi:hypothetical protein AB0P05_26550 [Streptomyces flaveolus]|uniref:hypothetical protein n=1 Tax=Streptomyces flaveolus TaxID=67297 RepID=UPI00341A366D
MTTPAQNVPDDFQDTLDLPEASIDPAAVQKANQGLDKAKAGSKRATEQLRTAQDRLKALKHQAARKGLSEAQKKRLQKAIGDAERAAKVQQKAVDTANTGIQTAQSKVYEASGQYDKLLSGANRDAYLALKSLFNGYGLGSLAGKIYDYVKQGYGADTISLLLQDTPEYKKRFAGNEARIKAGLPVLSPADYLATESAYRQVLSSAGLPAGFYDNPADFQKWIAADVSPTEIKDRVDLATQAVSQSNPAYRQALSQMYGISESDLTAYFLDRKTAEPILKKQAAAAAIGAAAIRRGFAANALDLEGYATMGVTADEAEQVYGQIADSMDTMLNIAGRFGSVWNQRLAEQEAFTPGAVSAPGQESASALGKRLRSQERAMFSGGQGSSVAGLNPGYSQT